MCIFGDEYGECPVIPKLTEMMMEITQTLKTIKIGGSKDFEDATKSMMDTLSTVMSAPPTTLSQFCQACPKVRKR